MDKKYQMTFYKAEFLQYNQILSDEDIRDKVSGFLLKFISLESFYKKMLVAVREGNGIKLSKKEKKNLKIDVNSINSVLVHFEVVCDEKLVNRIFGSKDNNYMECSIKKLRDRLVHNVNENVLRVIIERYDIMMNDMETFEKLLNAR